MFKLKKTTNWVATYDNTIGDGSSEVLDNRLFFLKISSNNLECLEPCEHVRSSFNALWIFDKYNIGLGFTKRLKKF